MLAISTVIVLVVALSHLKFDQHVLDHEKRLDVASEVHLNFEDDVVGIWLIRRKVRDRDKEKLEARTTAYVCAGPVCRLTVNTPTGSTALLDRAP